MEENNKEEKNPVEEANPTSTKENENDTHKADATVDGCSSEKQESIPLKEWWIEKYTIYDYLKANPAIFIAAVSGIIALGSFCASLYDYVSSTKMLEYFHFTSSIYEPAKASFSARFGASAIHFAINVLLGILIINFLRLYFYNNYTERLLLAQINEIRKGRRRSIRRLNRASLIVMLEKAILLIGFPPNHAIREDIIQKEEAFILSEKKKLNEAGKDIKTLKKTVKDLIKERTKLYGLVVLSALYWISEYADFSRTITSKTYYPLIFSTLLTGGFLTFSIIMGLLYPENRIKTESKTNPPKSAKREKKTFVFEKMFIDGIRPFFSNANVVVLSMGLVLSMASMVFLVELVPFNSSLVSNRIANIVTIENKQYFIVYQSGQLLYLEEAIIDDDTLYVNVNKKKIIDTSDIEADTYRIKKIVIEEEKGK